MSDPKTRLALAELIADKIQELGVDRREFMQKTGFTKASAFTSYLRGFASLQIWQVPHVAKILKLDERALLLMCLAQFHDDWDMALFHRHIRPRRQHTP